MARHTMAQVGAKTSGWYNAQPLFDWIIAEQPDLLD